MSCFIRCNAVLDLGAVERKMQKLQTLITHDPCCEITHSLAKIKIIKTAIFTISHKQDQFSISVLVVSFLMFSIHKYNTFKTCN